MICRTGEENKNWFRCERFFSVNGEWFFTTREQTNIGPFGSVLEARQGLNRYTHQLATDTNQSEKMAARTAMNGRWASNLYR